MREPDGWPAPADAEVVARFRAKVVVAPGYHWWVGAIADDGYGRFQAGRGAAATIVRSHRFAYELAHGPVGPGRVVMHSCDETICVRVDHLIAGTQAQNLAMAAGRDRLRPGWRWGDPDRGQAVARARAIRACLLEHGYVPALFEDVLAAGDPRADQLQLEL